MHTPSSSSSSSSSSSLSLYLSLSPPFRKIEERYLTLVSFHLNPLSLQNVFWQIGCRLCIHTSAAWTNSSHQSCHMLHPGESEHESILSLSILPVLYVEGGTGADPSGRVTPWTGRQCITGPKRQTIIHTHIHNSMICMSLDAGGSQRTTAPPSRPWLKCDCWNGFITNSKMLCLIQRDS